MSHPGLKLDQGCTITEHKERASICSRLVSFEIFSDDKALGINGQHWLANFRIARVKMRWHEWW